MAPHTDEEITDVHNLLRHEHERNCDKNILDQQTQEKTSKEYFWGDCYDCDVKGTNFMQKSCPKPQVLYIIGNL